MEIFTDKAPKQKMGIGQLIDSIRKFKLDRKELEFRRGQNRCCGVYFTVVHSGPDRIYSNIYDVLCGNGKLEITLPEVETNNCNCRMS